MLGPIVLVDRFVSRFLLSLALLALFGCTQDRPIGRVAPRVVEDEPREVARPREVAGPAMPARSAFVPADAPSTEGWNDAQIDWVPYETGLAQARASGRPMLLVLTASWCPHCQNYSHVFEDARVVERSRELVMVRVDTDEQREIAARYVVDGGYVPRTYFLAPSGEPLPIDAQRPRYRYFFDERNPLSILSGMERALATL